MFNKKFIGFRRWKIDNGEDKNDKSLPIWEQRFGIWLGVITSIVALILALDLGKKGQKIQQMENLVNKQDTLIHLLTYADTVQQNQIDTLTSIIKELRVQSVTQNEILTGSNKQNKLIADDIDEAKKISNFSNRQLELSIKAMNKSNLIDSFEIEIGKLNLQKIIQQLADSMGIYRLDIIRNQEDNFVDSRYNRGLQMLKKAKDLIDGQSANQYFLKDKELKKRWYKIGDQIRNILFSDEVNSSADRIGTDQAIMQVKGEVEDIFINLVNL